MKLKRVYCKHFPPSGYMALTLWPWVFIREKARERYTAKVDRHETTHALQQIETLLVFFLIIYGLEYVIKLVICGFDHSRAYYSISFEQEAYLWESNPGYNYIRKHYAWMRFVFKLYKK